MGSTYMLIATNDQRHRLVLTTGLDYAQRRPSPAAAVEAPEHGTHPNMEEE